MHRLRTIVLTLLVASAALVTAPTAQASEVRKACAGTANLSVGQPLSLTGTVTTSFSVNWIDGVLYCPALAGRLTGSCASVSGAGASQLGHKLSINSAGSTLVITGAGIDGVIVLSSTSAICSNPSTTFNGPGELTYET